jgi:caffeoyl-CoA O-methyltransferase
MSSRSIALEDGLYDYYRSVACREPPLLARLRAETATLPTAGAQISPEQGQLLTLLAELIGARQALEIGTFTGYGSLCIAGALLPGGRLVTLEANDKVAAIAARYWREAGLDGRIDLRLGLALPSLDALLAEGRAGSFDFAFIDADKKGYDAYYERTLLLLREGGAIVLDNMLWYGAVIDPARTEKSTRAIRALNLKLRDDARVSMCMLPIGDGMTILRKRPA